MGWQVLTENETAPDVRTGSLAAEIRSDRFDNCGSPVRSAWLPLPARTG
ncbi:MAG: hypothetical protein HYS12_19530 [Planctomycetes bacterium]|nr:hypothetical protein [Planctomycetota bacterium]